MTAHRAVLLGLSGFVVAAAIAVYVIGTYGAAAPTIAVRLAPSGEAGWRLDYSLTRAVRRLDLGPNLNGFRARDWRVETENLEIIGEGGRDFLILREAGAHFSRASIAISPQAEDFAKSYAPIRKVGAGAVLYTGHFWPYTEEGVRYDAAFSISPAPGGRVSAFGEERGEFENWKSPTKHPAFVYVGPLAISVAGGANALIDPAVPDWVRADVAALTPRLFAFYARALGRDLAQRPDLLLVMGDEGDVDASADAGRLRYDGDALPGQIEIALSGGAWRAPSPGARALLKLATAHEAAHLWLTAARPSRAGAPNWIHEGGAEALAVEALVAIGDSPPEELSHALAASRAECAGALNRRSLAGAEAEGAWRASYACGHALAIIAARAGEPAGLAADFWRDFIARAAAAGGYDEALFFAMIEARAGREVADAIRRFPTTAFAAPEKELTRLLALVDRAP